MTLSTTPVFRAVTGARGQPHTSEHKDSQENCQVTCRSKEASGFKRRLETIGHKVERSLTL